MADKVIQAVVPVVTAVAPSKVEPSVAMPPSSHAAVQAAVVPVAVARYNMQDDIFADMRHAWEWIKYKLGLSPTIVVHTPTGPVVVKTPPPAKAPPVVSIDTSRGPVSGSPDFCFSFLRGFRDNVFDQPYAEDQAGTTDAALGYSAGWQQAWSDYQVAAGQAVDGGGYGGSGVAATAVSGIGCLPQNALATQGVLRGQSAVGALRRNSLRKR